MAYLGNKKREKYTHTNNCLTKKKKKLLRCDEICKKIIKKHQKIGTDDMF